MLRFDEDIAEKCESVLEQLATIEVVYRQLLAKSLGANRRKINFDLLKSTIENVNDQEAELFIKQQLDQYADNRGIQEVVSEYYRFLIFKKSIESSFSNFSFRNIKSSYMLPTFNIEDYPTLDIYSVYTAPADLRKQAMPIKLVLEGVIEEVKAIHLQASFSVDNRSGLLFNPEKNSVNVRRQGVVQLDAQRIIVSSNSESNATDRRKKQLVLDMKRKQNEDDIKEAKEYLNFRDNDLRDKRFSALLTIKFEDEFIKLFVQNAENNRVSREHVFSKDVYNSLLQKYITINKLTAACEEYKKHLVNVDAARFAKVLAQNGKENPAAAKSIFESKVFVYRNIRDALAMSGSADQALAGVNAIVSAPETKKILSANRDSAGSRFFKGLLLVISFGFSARKPGLWKSHGAVHAEKLESIVNPAKGHSRS